MGGSLAGALRGMGNSPRLCRRVVGIVRREAALPQAVLWVDEATTDLARLATADAVVLATPPRTILALLPRVAPLLRPRVLLTDLGSTKNAIVNAMAELPPDILVVGSHPMCGKEDAGLAAADPGLFQGAAFVFCPVPDRPLEALARACDLARAVGARPIVMDAPTHDRITAAVSHIPYAAAIALVAAAEQVAAGGADDALWQLAAGGFRDTTRIAVGDLDMWVDILLTNRSEILAHLRRLDRALAALTEAVLEEDAARLRALLARAQQRRRAGSF